MSYRPITDVWVLARPKVKYYGAYPSGFLERARALLGVGPKDSVLHVCSGRVTDYPFRGFSEHDFTVDLDPENKPDFVMDVRKELPKHTVMVIGGNPWDAILADPPYSRKDATHYEPGADKLPEPGPLLKLCLQHVRPGGRVGMLHYQWPRPPKKVDGYQIRPVALIGVAVGWGNNLRCFSVFEKAT